MATFLTNAADYGGALLILACLSVFFGVVMGLYTRGGSEISHHPYTKGADGSGLRTDMPAEEAEGEDIEPLLWPRRAGRRSDP